MSELHVADSQQRQAALDPSQSFIVQAPAGSGKTELLMQRYLVLLAQVEQPEEVIAITFTRKASAEMRERILSALNDASSWSADKQGKDSPELPHEKKTRKIAESVLQRSRELQWRLLQNPNRLRIMTIDSLCASLVRQMPILSRSGVNPETTEDASELYRQAARATLEILLNQDTAGKPDRYQQDIARLLLHLDNDWQKLEGMLSSLLQKRDHWIRHLPASTTPQDMQQERLKLEAGLQAIVEKTLEEIQRAVPKAALQEWLDLASFAVENIDFSKHGDHVLLGCRGLEEFPTTLAEQLSVWKGLIWLVLTEKDDYRKSVTVKQGFPAPSGSKNPEEKSIFKNNKEQILGLIGQLAEIPDVLEQLCTIRELPAPTYTDEQWQILKALFNVLKLAVAQLQLVFSKKGQVDFVGVNLCAFNALINACEVDPAQPSDLALALDYQIKHLLVDEFQDTSISQYSLLLQLLAGWELGDGRSLFLVGDPMQSIYRFREAEVGLFLEIQQQGFLGQVPIVPLRLEVNFRSDKLVVDWINRVFQKAMPATSSVTMGAVNYSPSQVMQQTSAATVDFHPLIDDINSDGNDEAQLVCELLSMAKTGQGSTAILVRNKSHLVNIMRVMQKNNRPYQAVELEGLMRRPAIRDLHALTRALLHPADRVAWLSILRAPWCGMTLLDLEILVAGSQKTIWDLINDQERVIALSEDGQRRLSRVREVLKHALQQRRRKKLARWVEDAWLCLGGPACLKNESELPNTKNYFDLLHQLDQGGEPESFESLEQALTRLFAVPPVISSEQTPVQLMTIHKAKGLEFDTVIIPSLHRPPRHDDRQLLQWTEWRSPQSDLDTPASLLLAPIEQTGSNKSEINQFLMNLENERGRHESTRLLYVACTRARRHLHLIGSVKSKANGDLSPPSKKSLLARIWSSVESEFLSCETEEGSSPDHGDDQSEFAEPMPFLPEIQRMQPQWQMPQLVKPVVWEIAGAMENIEVETPQNIDLDIEYSWASASARHTGTVVHYFLQRIAEEGLDKWDVKKLTNLTPVIKGLLKEHGLSASAIEPAQQRILNSLTKTLQDERGRWVLGDQHRDARNEYALTGVINGEVKRVIVDRTFIDQQDIRWIVDYKTSSHEGGDLSGFLDNERERYRAQLHTYAQLLRNLDDRPIRLALYFPLLIGWREWNYED